MRLPEITAPVDLCDRRGRLNRAAVGWTRQPLHRANLRGWGRTKRWEYWGVVTPTHVVGMTISSLDYAGVEGVYLLERATGEETVRETVTPLGRGVALTDAVGTGRFAGGGLRLEFTTAGDGVRLRAVAEDVDVDLLAGPGGESMGVVVPWSDRLFQYTVKDVCRPVTGTLAVGGSTYDASGWGVLDHGRGRWPYRISWNWAAGSGLVAGQVRGLQLGGRWTTGTGSTENAVRVGPRLHKLHEELTWDYDDRTWLRPWRIHGERIDVTMTPFHVREASTNLLAVGNRTHQCFGEFTGWAATDDGERVRLDGLVGWAEEVHNRW